MQDAAGPDPLPRYLPARAACWLGSLCLFVGVAWSALTEVETVVTAPAIARPDDGVAELRAPVSARVREVLIEEGAAVGAGAAVVLLDNATEVAKLRAAELALSSKRRWRAELTEVVRLLESGGPLGAGSSDAVRRRVLEHRSRLASRDWELDAMVAELEALSARIRTAQGLLAIQQERHSGAEAALAQQALSRFEWLRARQEFLAQRADLETSHSQSAVLRRRIVAQRSARRELAIAQRQELAEALAELAVDIADLESVAAQARQQLAHSRVLAPRGGIVDQLHVAAGDLLERGAAVGVVVPVGRSLIFETRVAPHQSAFLQAGQACRIKLDALPFPRYGTLPCVVVRIGRDVVDASAAGQGGHYLVRVEPLAHALEAGGQALDLAPGATGWVDVITGRRTVLSFVTDPLQRFASESMRER